MNKLKEMAKEAADNAYAPYSHYHVGAALETAGGKIYVGCNVESSSYGLTVCAERNAIGSAIVAGERDFKAIAVLSRDCAAPCGACRQVIWDLCGDIAVYLFDNDGNEKELTSAELLPEPFDKTNLEV